MDLLRELAFFPWLDSSTDTFGRCNLEDVGKAKRAKYNWLASLLVFCMVALSIGWWLIWRKSPVSLVDVDWFLVGVLSMLWIVVWMRMKGVSRQSLIVPYAPIFVVPGLGILGNQMGWLSNYELMNLLILFWCGFVLMVPVLSILSGLGKVVEKKK